MDCIVIWSDGADTIGLHRNGIAINDLKLIAARFRRIGSVSCVFRSDRMTAFFQAFKRNTGLAIAHDGFFHNLSVQLESNHAAGIGSGERSGKGHGNSIWDIPSVRLGRDSHHTAVHGIRNVVGTAVEAVYAAVIDNLSITADGTLIADCAVVGQNHSIRDDKVAAFGNGKGSAL